MGAVLFATGSLGHVASFIVLVVLAAALLILDRAGARGDRTVLLALGVGLALAIAYYSSFTQMILDQLPRLGEGGGSGKTTAGLWERLRFEGSWARTRWGLPASALALCGWPRPSRSPLDRRLAGYWLAGSWLFVAALLSPLDVRYLYALTPALAVCAARGFGALTARGGVARFLGWLLLLAAVLVGGLAIHEAVWLRYR